VKHGLAGYRILVVEDEAVIALLIEQNLLDLGCQVVGPVGSLAAALTLARDEDIDGAILDVTIRGGKVYPVAEILRSRGIPLVLASGYADWALPADFQQMERLVKPFTSAEMEQRLTSMLRNADAGGGGRA
jgi:DNA-binding response OmpR family regulator